MRHNPILACAVVSLLIGSVAGCAGPEEQAYKRARMTDTVVAWEEFLRRYPAGEETAKARQRLAELHEDHEWQRAGLANTVAAYEQYLRGYPQGRFANEALVRIANLNLQDVPDHEPTPDELRAARTASPPAKPAPKPVADKPAAPPPAKPAPKPVADKPAAPAPAKPAPKPVADKPAAPPPATGAWSIQLGAFAKGEAAARIHWQKLERTVPALAAFAPEVVAPAGGRPFHRLRLTGLDRERARELCVAIRATGEGCVVTAP